MKRHLIIALIAGAIFTATAPRAHAQYTSNGNSYIDQMIRSRRDARILKRCIEARKRGENPGKTREPRKTGSLQAKAPTQAKRPALKRIAATIVINGKTLESDVMPIQKNGRLYLPLRDVFEALDAKVEYDKESGGITADANSRRIYLSVASNADEDERPDKPFVNHGVTMVPLRFVAEQFDIPVNYVARSGKPLIEIGSKS